MKKSNYFIILLCLFCASLGFAAPLCGDVNSDGVTNIVDALLIAQDYVGPGNLSAATADVNADKSVSIVDALLVAQYYVGIITELKCSGGGGPVGPTDPPVNMDVVKPRIVATTDGEIDDRSTMVRFLMYATDYDIQGIIQVNSRYQKKGHSKDKWIEKEIDLYEKVLPNLKKHKSGWPEPSYLRSIMKVGNENSGDLYKTPPTFSTKDTAGAQHIIDVLLDKDPRPVHVPSWGGANTTAYALYKLKKEYSRAEFEYAASRIRIYCIWYQDGGGKWIQNNIPEAYIYEAFGWDNTWDYQSTSSKANPPEQRKYMTADWLNTHVKKNHGVLGAYTPQKYISEGDTPSFLNLIDNGLRGHENYTLGGWGGRGVVVNGRYLTDKPIINSIKDKLQRKRHYWRWIIDCQNDFQARMDWCVKPFSGANHPPELSVSGSYTNAVGGMAQTVSPGATVKLQGSATDPDKDSLSYTWWQHHERDSASAKVSISNANSQNATFKVPNEKGKTVEIIFEVKDNGTPPLKRYQRLMFNIK